MTKFNYYKNELERLGLTDTMQVKVFNGEGLESKFLTLNLESIKELRDFLDSLESHLSCECCHGKGYLEVTHEDGEYIEDCEECDYFGIIEPVGSNQINKNAWGKAIKDGYKLTKTGKIKE